MTDRNDDALHDGALHDEARLQPQDDPTERVDAAKGEQPLDADEGEPDITAFQADAADAGDGSDGDGRTDSPRSHGYGYE